MHRSEQVAPPECGADCATDAQGWLRFAIPMRAHLVHALCPAIAAATLTDRSSSSRSKTHPSRRYPLTPPSSATRNQHAVVHHVDAQCACTGYWTYTVRIGVEPFRAVHARPVGLAPPQGCARLSRFRLPTRLSQEDQSSNQLPEYAYPTGAVPSQDRPPCVELLQRSPC